VRSRAAGRSGLLKIVPVWRCENEVMQGGVHATNTEAPQDKPSFS
jgi:hypothetical protein